MATTTAQAIRNAIAARLEALVPAVQVAQDRGCNRFKRRTDCWSLLDIRAAPTSADDRTFIIRLQGGLDVLSPTDAVEARVQIAATLSLLYWLPNDDQSDGLDVRIQQDAVDIQRDLLAWAIGEPVAGMLPTTGVVRDGAPDVLRTGNGEVFAVIKHIELLLDYWRAS